MKADAGAHRQGPQFGKCFIDYVGIAGHNAAYLPSLESGPRRATSNSRGAG